MKQATSRKKTSGGAAREIRYSRMAGPHQLAGVRRVRRGGRPTSRWSWCGTRCARTASRGRPTRCSCSPASRARSCGCTRPHRPPRPQGAQRARRRDNRALLIDLAGATCTTTRPSGWGGRWTKKYRPPEMRDKVAAQPSMDVYCFGLMVDKLLRQRARPSEESGRSSSAATSGATACCRSSSPTSTSRDLRDRPHAWSLLARLQRHVGETARCDARRERVPPSRAADGGPPPPPARRRRRRRRTPGSPSRRRRPRAASASAAARRRRWQRAATAARAAGAGAAAAAATAAERPLSVCTVV